MVFLPVRLWQWMEEACNAEYGIEVDEVTSMESLTYFATGRATKMGQDSEDLSTLFCTELAVPPPHA